MDKLPREITDNGITYTLHGEYYLPNIVLSSDDNRPIGRWGRMHKKYLLGNRPVIYNDLVVKDKLVSYLADLNEQAEGRLESIVNDMKEQEGVTEALKASDQMEWIRRMNSIRSRAEEIILSELIFV